MDASLTRRPTHRFRSHRYAEAPITSANFFDEMSPRRNKQRQRDPRPMKAILCFKFHAEYDDFYYWTKDARTMQQEKALPTQTLLMNLSTKAKAGFHLLKIQADALQMAEHLAQFHDICHSPFLDDCHLHTTDKTAIDEQMYSPTTKLISTTKRPDHVAMTPCSCS
uniref:Uncharacterized protein n=1 Tax=Panagrellus redivivus TaxID=6233 RepID=A0A7E4UZ19_PANRE